MNDKTENTGTENIAVPEDAAGRDEAASPASSGTFHERKIFLIDKKVQYDFLRFVMITLTCLCVLFGSMLVWQNNTSTNGIIGYLEATYVSAPSETRQGMVDGMREEQTRFSIFVLLGTMAVIGVVGYLSILESHKLAGPVYRLKKTIKEFRDGDRSVRATLRADDHFHDLAEELNALLDTFEKEAGSASGQ